MDGSSCLGWSGIGHITQTMLRKSPARVALAVLLLTITGAGATVAVAQLTGGPQLLEGQSSGPPEPSVEVSSDSEVQVPAGANWLPCTGAEDPLNFAGFSLGEEYQGIELATVQRLCVTPSGSPETIRPNFINYLYGECELVADEDGYVDGGCAPPLQVQSYPACERALADYRLDADEAYPQGKRVTLPGGAVRVSFDGGTRVETYTGESTVVVFGDDPKLVAGAADALTLDQQSDEVGKPVPTSKTSNQFSRPSAGSLAGELKCRG